MTPQEDLELKYIIQRLVSLRNSTKDEVLKSGLDRRLFSENEPAIILEMILRPPSEYTTCPRCNGTGSIG